MLCFPRRARVMWRAVIWRSPGLARLAARQHPRVDPIFEIGRGTDLGLVLAGKSRHHLAQDAEADALRRLVPHHRFLCREWPEARHEILPPDHDGLRLGQMLRFRRYGFALERRPDFGGISVEGEADCGWMRLEDETRPRLGYERRERVDTKRLGVRPVEGIGERLLQLGELGDLSMFGVGLAFPHEGGKVTAEPPRTPLVRRIGGDIGFDQTRKTLIAEIGMQLLIVVAENLGEPRDIGVAIDAEQHVTLLLGAVFDLGKDGVVAGKNAALEGLLQLFEALHSAASSRFSPSTSRAMERAWSSSSTSSASGGMLSSRSIMVDTGPK